MVFPAWSFLKSSKMFVYTVVVRAGPGWSRLVRAVCVSCSVLSRVPAPAVRRQAVASSDSGSRHLLPLDNYPPLCLVGSGEWGDSTIDRHHRWHNSSIHECYSTPPGSISEKLMILVAFFCSGNTQSLFIQTQRKFHFLAWPGLWLWLAHLIQPWRKTMTRSVPPYYLDAINLYFIYSSWLLLRFNIYKKYLRSSHLMDNKSPDLSNEIVILNYHLKKGRLFLKLLLMNFIHFLSDILQKTFPKVR